MVAEIARGTADRRAGGGCHVPHRRSAAVPECVAPGAAPEKRGTGARIRGAASRRAARDARRHRPRGFRAARVHAIGACNMSTRESRFEEAGGLPDHAQTSLHCCAHRTRAAAAQTVRCQAIASHGERRDPGRDCSRVGTRGFRQTRTTRRTRTHFDLPAHSRSAEHQNGGKADVTAGIEILEPLSEPRSRARKAMHRAVRFICAHDNCAIHTGHDRLFASDLQAGLRAFGGEALRRE